MIQATNKNILHQVNKKSHAGNYSLTKPSAMRQQIVKHFMPENKNELIDDHKATKNNS